MAKSKDKRKETKKAPKTANPAPQSKPKKK